MISYRLPTIILIIIESNNEFNDDEKAMIYAGLMVSIYSPQIWDNFK